MKKTSEMKCGLIGKPLGHSYSPLIHSCLADYEYKLIELDENEVGSFIKSDKYDALNVTIPYKKTVMPFLDVISPEAERIGSVNTVTHLPDGRQHRLLWILLHARQRKNRREREESPCSRQRRSFNDRTYRCG